MHHPTTRADVYDKVTKIELYITARETLKKLLSEDTDIDTAILTLCQAHRKAIKNATAKKEA